MFDDKGVEARHFFMNAFSTAQENHLAFLSSYKKVDRDRGRRQDRAHGVRLELPRHRQLQRGRRVIGTTCNAPRRLPGGDGQLMLPPFYANPNDNYKVVGDQPDLDHGGRAISRGSRRLRTSR